MATKTENLQLWKWAKTDPVDVEQINDNFGKVDTYLGKNGALEKVAEFTVQSAAAEVDFNLSSLNLSSYSAIQLYFDLKFVYQEGPINPEIQINSGTPVYVASADNSYSQERTETSISILPGNQRPEYPAAARLELYQCGDKTAGMIQGIGYDTNQDRMYCLIRSLLLSEISLTELNKVTLALSGTHTNQYATGSALQIYGVKK